jgi:hypothetical protein
MAQTIEEKVRVALEDARDFPLTQRIAMLMYLSGVTADQAHETLVVPGLGFQDIPLYARLDVANHVRDLERQVPFAREGQRTRLEYLAQNLVCDRTRRLGRP